MGISNRIGCSEMECAKKNILFNYFSDLVLELSEKNMKKEILKQCINRNNPYAEYCPVTNGIPSENLLSQVKNCVKKLQKRTQEIIVREDKRIN